MNTHLWQEFNCWLLCETPNDRWQNDRVGRRSRILADQFETVNYYLPLLQWRILQSLMVIVINLLSLLVITSYQLDSILSNDLRGDDITSWAIWTQLLPMQYSRNFSGHSCQHGMHTTVGIWPGRTQHSPIRAAIIPTSHSYGRADYDDYDCLKYTRRTKKEREPADSTNRRMVAPESVVESVPSNKYIEERHR